MQSKPDREIEDHAADGCGDGGKGSRKRAAFAQAFGHPGADAIARAADIMREEKGWTQAATLAEIDAVERRFKAAHAKAVA